MDQSDCAILITYTYTLETNVITKSCTNSHLPVVLAVSLHKRKNHVQLEYVKLCILSVEIYETRRFLDCSVPNAARIYLLSCPAICGLTKILSIPV